MQENENQTPNVTNNTNSAPVQPAPTNKEKAQAAGKDIAEVAAKGAATYFGGPIGGRVAGKVLNSKVGQKVTGTAGKAIARNPLSRGALSKAQPAISASKPLANSAIGALGAKGGSGGMSASLGSSATPASSPTGTNNLGIPKSPLPGGNNQSSSSDDNQSSSPLGGGLNPLKNNDGDSNKEKGIANVIQTWWKKIPVSAKLGIICGAGAFLIVVIIAAFFMGLSNMFLDYSDSVAESENYKEEYEEYFQALCDDDDDCTEEEKERAKNLIASQESFYKRLDALSEKYFASDERSKQKQRYIVLTTVFYGYSPEDMLKGGAFNLDEDGDDEIDENTNNDSNVYKEEYDTLKELAKQFDVYTPFCIYTITNSDGTTEEKQEEIKDYDGNTFKLGYWDAVKVGWPVWNNPIEGFEEARTSCNEKSGRVSTQKSAGQAAEDNFYKYLLESTFLDKRSSLRESFVNYAQSHGLDKDNIDTDHWPEEDLQEVRKQVIEDIKNIVEAQMPEEEESQIGMNNMAYWWPIGSLKTTLKKASYSTGEIDNGTPATINISQHYNADHYAIDIAPPNESGEVPVIAAQEGEVVLMSSTIDMPETNSDANAYPYPSDSLESYGNFVKLKHPDGTYTLYAHMYQNTIEVKLGDIVKQGQIIGYVGNSGNTTGTHLHFEVRDTNDMRINPENKSNTLGNYVDVRDVRSTKHKWWPIGSKLASSTISGDKKEAYVNGSKITVEAKEYAAAEMDDSVVGGGSVPAGYKLFASGAPQYTGVNSPYGWRILNGENNLHGGVDLQGDFGSTNVIASLTGKVVMMNNTCASNSTTDADHDCGGSYGNFIKIQDIRGNYEIYAHMTKESISLKVGDTVEQGQVLGKVGNSGNSYGAHLHFEIRDANDQRHDPLDGFISASDPRPERFSSANVSSTRVALIDYFEGSTTKDEATQTYLVVDIGDNVRTAGAGVVLDYHAAQFQKYGINVNNYPVGSKLPVAAVDAVHDEIIKGFSDSVENSLRAAGISLKENQVDALVSFSYNLGLGSFESFISNYKKYGDTQELYDNWWGNYVHVNGEVWQGLVNRRQKEWQVFHSGIYPF